MALLVILLGVLLMIGGAAFVALGFDIVMTERGAAMTMGGVTALSGGVVTLALGFALLRLSQILRALEGLRATSGAAPEGRSPIGLAVGGVAAGAAGAAAASLLADGARASPALDHAPPGNSGDDPLADFLGDPVQAKPADGPAAASHDVDEADPAASDRRAEAPSPVQPAGDNSAAAGDGDAAAVERLEPDDLSVDHGSQPTPADAEGAASAASTAARDGAPTVLGSYRAGGRTYTMYSDGSVEAASDDGVERFASMQMLREHLARN